MKILVTAGPTREFLDPVRFLSNRSTGKMGYAVAERAIARGFETTLVSGPVALAPPAGAKLVSVVSALEMLEAVREALPGHDALVMAAAVADWRPVKRSVGKLKKREMSTCLELEQNPDILTTLQPMKGRGIWVGFAAETSRLLDEAKSKLLRKSLDMIVANDVSQTDAGFEVDTNRVVLLSRNEKTRFLPLMQKIEVADCILDWIEDQKNMA